MNSLNWYYNRLKNMSLAEVLFHRIPQFYQFKVLGKIQAKKNIEILQLNQGFKPPKFNRKSLTELFHKSNFSTDIKVFETSINFYEIKNWRKDYKNKKESPLKYYAHIDRQNFKLHGDVKYLAELSRFDFLPFMAFKAIESNDQKLLFQIEKAISEWNQQNPYLYSIHWTSGIEVAIRAVNLIFTHLVLKKFNKIDAALEVEIFKNASQAYQFLKHHLSQYSSANNHLTAELMGLNAISSYFQVPLKERKKWQAALEKQIQLQVNADGVHMELCTHYHAEVLEQFMISKVFLNATKKQLNTESENSIKKMFNFINHSVSKGITTIFGDNDEGAVVKPSFEEKETHYKSLLKTSNFLYNTQFENDGNLDFKNYLLLGEDFKVEARSNSVNDTFFKDSGYGFWYDHSTNCKFTFDVGKIGDNLLAAHGHSDIFHFNFAINELEFLIDIGTYQYHSKEIFWRDYFRGATAHNVLTINKSNHATNNGRMSWVNRPDVKVENYTENFEHCFCQASTNAFKNEGVEKHTRSFRWNKNERTLIIEDKLNVKDSNEKQVDILFHFHPQVKASKQGNQIVAVRDGVQLKIENQECKEVSLIKGDDEEPLGWYSKNFGKKVATNVLQLRFLINSNFKSSTKLTY